MTSIYRTPDERFADLPDFPWEPVYREWEGMRVAHIDVGNRDAPAVVFWHGEPTWSFLWRHVIPPVLEAGYRCLAMDMPGFGRSDKPTELAWYSYDFHAYAGASFAKDLDLGQDTTHVVHDWGGPVGLRTAMEHPQHAGRLVILDTGLFTGEQPMSDTWKTFRDFVEQNEDIPVGQLVSGGCHTPLAPEVLAAYDAPFPVPASKVGPRSFPLIMPTRPDDLGAAAGRTTLESLRRTSLPTLVMWADSDPIIPLKVGHRFAEMLGHEEAVVIEQAGHFLQEDQGTLIGEKIAAWLGPAG